MKSYEILINVNELRANLESAGWRIVDCRFNLLQPRQGREQYLASHIPGAVYADLDNDLAGPVTEQSGRHPLPDPDDLADTLGRLGIDNDTQVVVYDDASGAIAARLWWLLNWLGHRKVALLNGGFSAWQKMESVTDEATVIKRNDFSPKRFEQDVISSETLAASVTDGDMPRLVDARDRARFAGEVEPIDTIAGHIPGALNFPFVDSLEVDGSWQDVSALQERWSAVLGPDRESSWIAMCGSGVTACHLAISAQLAGYPTPVLYAGSWSEWIRDPARPVTSGIC